VKVCFNPRARVGRDEAREKLELDGVVSIHAPAWGATALINAMEFISQVSIHAPAWGATGLDCRASKKLGCFNPRARVGRDLKAFSANYQRYCCFNPRARVGRDAIKD